MNTKQNLHREVDSEEITVIFQACLNAVFVASCFYYLQTLDFKSSSFSVHLFSLGFLMSGFFHLAYLMLGSIITGDPNLFFIKKFVFFIPLMLIMLLAYFILVFAYPFLIPLISFSFFDKIALHVSTFFFAIFVLTSFFYKQMRN